jgi:hypothetical protein
VTPGDLADSPVNDYVWRRARQERRNVRHMAFEQLKAQIGILLGEVNRAPEDLHELYEQIHQELNQLRVTGAELPADLLALEQKLLDAFPRPPARRT